MMGTSNGASTATLAAALLALLAAVPTKAQELRVWRHGVLEAKSDAGFVMMASRRGFDQKHGLKIETVAMKNGQTQVRALISGDLDSIESGAGEEIIAASAGADIKIIGCPWPGLPHVVLANTSIATPQDLKGKTIATSAPGSLPDLVARALLEKYGIAPTEVRFASVGGDLDRYKALTAGIVEATVVSLEYLPIVPKDIHLLVAAREIMPNYLRWCTATTGKRLAERRDDAIRFMAAQMEALQYAMSHRDETLKLTREVANIKSEDPRPEFVFDEIVRTKGIDPTLSIPKEKLEWMQDQFIKTGNLKNKLDLTQILDTDVRVKAQASLGEK
jgi:NitT/TauT family transport system substrate-binding protein